MWPREREEFVINIYIAKDFINLQYADIWPWQSKDKFKTIEKKRNRWIKSRRFLSYHVRRERIRPKLSVLPENTRFSLKYYSKNIIFKTRKVFAEIKLIQSCAAFIFANYFNAPAIPSRPANKSLHPGLIDYWKFPVPNLIINFFGQTRVSPYGFIILLLYTFYEFALGVTP